MIKFSILTGALLLILALSVQAQQDITIDNVSNLLPDLRCDKIAGGSSHIVTLRVRNLGTPQGSWYDYSNAFRIYSPDGANYGIIVADTLINPATPGHAFLGKMQSPTCTITYLSNDGHGADTVIFHGANASDSNPGLYPGLNNVVWSLTFHSLVSDSGRHICIEAIAPPSGNWTWTGHGTSDTTPGWYVNHCFTIIAIPNCRNCPPPAEAAFCPPNCCVGTPGNIDCDPDETVDIADLTRLVDALFISFAPFCCVYEADVDNSGNLPDIGDLTVLVDYLFLSFSPLPSCP